MFWSTSDLPGSLLEAFRLCSLDLWGRTWTVVILWLIPFSLLPGQELSKSQCPVNQRFSILAEGPVCSCSCVLWVIFPLILVGSSFLDLGHFLIHTWLSTFLNSPMELLKPPGFLILCSSLPASTLTYGFSFLWSFWLSVPLPQFSKTVEFQLESPSLCQGVTVNRYNSRLASRTLCSEKLLSFVAFCQCLHNYGVHYFVGILCGFK